MAITQLLAPTIILNEGAISATATMPTIPAAVLGNRVVVVTFAMYNGGGTSLPPTAPICNGVSPTFIEGDTVAQTRTTAASWYFKEADIASISGQTLTSTTGAAGSQKSITVEVYDDCAQTVPTNKNKGYLSATGLITLALTRNAGSRTIAKAFTSTSATALNFTFPTRTGTSNFTARWMSYASTANASLDTNNYTCSGSNFTTAHVFTIEPFPAGTINTVNGGTYNAVKAGSTGNTVNVSGFTPTSGTIGGKAISSIVSAGGGDYTFSAAPYVDGATYSEPDTTQALVLSDGVSSPTVNIPSSSPNGMDSVVVTSDVIIDNNEYLGYWMNLQGFPPVAGDRIVSTISEVDVASDGGVLADGAVITVVWLWKVSNSTLYSFTVTINEAGLITGVSRLLPLAIGLGFGI